MQSFAALSAPETALPLYPVMLTPTFFACRPVLVIGGGKVAERKIKNLLAIGASLIVIAPNITPALQELAKNGAFQHQARAYQIGDVVDCPEALLIFAATSDKSVNQVVAEEARAAGRLVNRADDAANSDFTLPGVVNNGDITFAVATNTFTTSGAASASPALTAFLKRRLQAEFGVEYDQFARLLREVRPLVKSRVAPPERPALWQKLLDSAALELLRAGQPLRAKALLEQIIDESKLA